MFVLLLVVHIIVSVTLVLVVLLQTGRGAELGAAFGGMGQATTAVGQTTFISKFTTGLAVVFMLTSLSLAFLTTERPSASLLEGKAVVAPTTEAQQPGTTGEGAKEDGAAKPEGATQNQ